MALIDVLSPIGDLLDKFIPDAKDKLAAKAELARIADAGAAREHEEAMGQIETNKVEAGHASIFVAGWRPFIGWIGGIGIAVVFVIYPLAAIFGAKLPEYPVDNLIVLVTGLLGWSGIRSWDKRQGIAFSKLGENPGMEVVKTVSGSATPALAQKLPVATSGETPAPAQEVADNAPLPFTAAPRQICWGSKVSRTFKERVLWIEQDLGLKADYLMACVAFETDGKFSASVRNYAGSSGTGLLQFMEFTAANLGTTTAKLAKMSAEDQLNYVWKYFRQFGTDLSRWSLEDTYMAILYPAAIGKPSSWPFPWSATSLAYKQNKGLDKNKDKVVTKAEAAAEVVRLYKQGMQEGNLG